MQDPRRDQAQDELLPLDVDGVSRVVSALIARDDGKARRDEVDNLPFAFIAPLPTENREVHSRVRFYFELRSRNRDGRKCAIARSSCESRKYFFIQDLF